MLPIERIERIKEIVSKKKNVKISELSEELNVSEMTIHRDVKQLVDDGFVVKTFGGISLAQTTPTETPDTKHDICSLCHRPVHDRFAYQLILTDDKIERTCCAHCGILRQLQLQHNVVKAITYDFFTGTTISAHIAYFVTEPSVQITCCQPQILVFNSKTNAERFVKGFSGIVHTYNEVLSKMKEHLNV